MRRRGRPVKYKPTREGEAALMQRDAKRTKAVEAELGDGVICTQCGATRLTYAKDCTADLAAKCDGFNRIEAAKAKARELFP